MKTTPISMTALALLLAGAAGCSTMFIKPAAVPPPEPAETPATRPVAPPTTGPATRPVDAGGVGAARLPYVVERFERDGPVRGVAVKVDVTDPRVRVRVALTDPNDPDGDGPAVGRLQTVSAAARAQRLAVALNASFFDIADGRTILGKRVGYFVGNGGWPLGYAMSDGRLLREPAGPTLRAALVVGQDGRARILDNVRALPSDARDVVSGSAKVLGDGIATVPASDAARHPRSAVGVSADGKTLILCAVDGRRDGWSRGVTLGELAALMKDLGASDALNLDGGGSTTLAVRDAVTGAYAVANRPSERAALVVGVDSVERPVVDLIGVEVEGE